MSTDAPPRQLDLPVQGMTCASCANRVERKLNQLDGVEATVNYATETAAVSYDPAQVEPARLLEAVEKIGYHAQPKEGAHVAHEHDAAPTKPQPITSSNMLPASTSSSIEKTKKLRYAKKRR